MEPVEVTGVYLMSNGIILFTIFITKDASRMASKGDILGDIHHFKGDFFLKSTTVLFNVLILNLHCKKLVVNFTTNFCHNTHYFCVVMFTTFVVTFTLYL